MLGSGVSRLAPAPLPLGFPGGTEIHRLYVPARHALVHGGVTSSIIEILRELADWKAFAVHSRGWVVERTFAWINRNRRLAKAFERSIRSATIFLDAAAARSLVRAVLLPAGIQERPLAIGVLYPLNAAIDPDALVATLNNGIEKCSGAELHPDAPVAAQPLMRAI